MKKKAFIIASAVVLVLAIVVVLLAIFGENEKITPDDPGSKYSYYYQKDGKNIVVTVEGEFPEGYAWFAEDSESGAARTSRLSSGKDKAEFSVSPVKEGRHTVVLVLKKDVIPEDRIYEIILNFNVDSSVNLKFSSSTHKELDGLKAFNSSGYDYAVFYGSGNEFDICIRNAKDRTFDCVIDNKIVTWNVITYTDETVNDKFFAITPVNFGDCTVYIVDVENGKAIKFGLNIDNTGKINVKTNEVIDYDGKKVIEDEDFESAEKLVGKIKLPKGAQRTGCDIKGYTNSYGTRFLGIDIKVSMLESLFDYIIFPEAEMTDISSFYASNGETKTKIELLGLEGYCYISEYYTTAVWAEGKNVFAVTVPSASIEEITDIAGAFVGSVEAK